MTRQQAYRTRARQQFNELQRHPEYRLGQSRRRQHDWTIVLFWLIVGVVVLTALTGVGIFIAAVWRLVATGLGW